MRRQMWLMLGLTASACGLAGVVVPLLPTTPFLLLAAFAFARSSPRLHAWLLDHPRFGPLISDWQSHGSIAPAVKLTAVAVMLATFVFSWLAGAPGTILLIQAAVLGAAAAFVLSRPSAPR